MKLSPINKYNIISAGEYIDKDGIPINNLYNNYWVLLPSGKEYPFKYLVKIAYQIVKDDDTFDFQSTESYRNYIKEFGFSINYYKEQLNFFTIFELEHYKSIAGNKYRKANSEDVQNGHLLRPIVAKLNKWAEKSQIEDFKVKKSSTWQWSGTFKSYLWLRTYRKGDSQKVYFVTGISSNGDFYIELNCQRSNHTRGTTTALSKSKINAFDSYRSSSGYLAKNIPKDELIKYDWDKLIEITQNHIYDNIPLYDELESLIKNDREVDIVQKNTLESVSPPLKTKSYSNRVRKFTGKKTNWEKKNRTSKFLGDEGERLVIRFEKDKLNQIGLYEKADQVEKKLDGEGYDIKSFDNNGDEIHIEVKTTVRNIEEPFYMSLNEVLYFKRPSNNNYYLYRLFDYNYVNKIASFYILSANDLLDMDFNPINYEVVINKN